jgi:RNA polymerase sigma factor (sigma-70 family)
MRQSVGQCPDEPDPQGSVSFFFDRLRAGDRAAAEALWQRYFPRLMGLARKMLRGRALPLADADDAVQSALASFFRRAEQGEFTDLDREHLWSLLATITVRKALKHRQREQTLKRGGGQVQQESQLGPADPQGTPFRLDLLSGPLPAEQIDLYCEELLLLLNDELQQIALWRLMGFTNREIAGRLACTERKIERKLHLIRLRWEAEVDAEP